MFLEEIIYKNSKGILTKKFEVLNLTEFQMMDAINGLMNQIDLVFENVDEQDISNRRGVVYINGYTMREWINHINETFYNFELQSSMINSVCNRCIEDIKKVSGRKRMKDVYLIFLKFKNDKNVKFMNVSNVEVVKHFS